MDVVIVGGGPAGLLAAARCAEAGLDVLVFEEHSTIGEPTHCTGIVSLETAEFAKVPEEIIVSRLSRARLHAPDGQAYELAWDAPEQILAIDRAAFDRELARQARAAGAQVQTGARVDGVAPGPDRVEVIAEGSTVRARACVLACGVTYRFQRRLGLGLPGQIVHTAQLEVEARSAESVDLYFGRAVAPEGFGWAVPVGRNAHARLKVGVMAQGDAAAALEGLLARPEVRGRLTGSPGRPIQRVLPLRPAPKSFGDQVLVVGDAGGFTKPTTGGGIFYSLLTASLAAETLIEAFKHDRFDAEFLSRYERRWRRRLGRELVVGGWLRNLVAELPDEDIATLLKGLAQEDVQAVMRGTARFNWHADVILALLRRNGLARLLCRALLR
jgi:digeranylgeranylglycerophospholipid reductase